jgi:hypothetical protein
MYYANKRGVKKMIETIKIGKWKVPKKLIDEYVKCTITADGYLNKTIATPSDNLPHADYERFTRWSLCVKKIMEIHREICKVVGVEYSENNDDEFYITFHSEIRKLLKFRG